MDHYASALGGIISIHFGRKLQIKKHHNRLKEFVLADSRSRKDTTGTNCETDVDQVGAVMDWGSDITCSDTFTAGQTIRGYTIDDAGTCTGCIVCFAAQFD